MCDVDALRLELACEQDALEWSELAPGEGRVTDVRLWELSLLRRRERIAMLEEQLAEMLP